MAKGKKYRAAMERIDRDQVYPPAAALKIVKEVAPAKFDETVEVHIKLGVDARQAEQQVRGTVVLPHGTGKSVHVIVFAQGEKEREATAAGADEVGSADLAEKIQKGWTDFDAAVATPDMMGTVGKLGKILGPRGLMPNPKSGTVTFDVAKAVKDLKAGRVEFRVDKFGIVHVAVGKVSFTEEQLGENYAALMDEINRAKPSAAKGKYLKSVTVTSTMGPGVRVDTSKAADLTEEAG